MSRNFGSVLMEFMELEERGRRGEREKETIARRKWFGRLPFPFT